MLTKIDRKVVIILFFIIAIILLIGFLAYRLMNTPSAEVQNVAGGAQTENSSSSSLGSSSSSSSSQGIQVNIAPDSGLDGLSICQDKCGDGICQASDPSCKDNLSCSCPETPQECPQDCK